MSARKSQVDIFFRHKNAHTDTSYFCKDIVVIGELKKTHDDRNFKSNLLQLARYARNTFLEQPLRLFVPCFLLCGTTMHLWNFDRSGPYSSEPFDIHKSPMEFATALVAYATMSQEQSSVLPHLRQAEAFGRITLKSAVDKGSESTFKLEKLLSSANSVVCRGTTCYQTEDGHVAKFAWVSEARTPEADLLLVAKNNRVRGVAEILASGDISSTEKLRDGLDFTTSHRFRNSSLNTSMRVGATNSSSSWLLPALRSTGSSSASTHKTWQNRVYRCHVVTPSGRLISTFQNVRELLEALLGAIEAHKSLYTQGGILHRDISPDNIIITKPEVANGCKGMLIDLDNAKIMGDEPSGAHHITGTKPFISINVLRGFDHTYRNDLESFLYVLIWMGARSAWATKPKGAPSISMLCDWEIGSCVHVADNKDGHIASAYLFERILMEFPPSLTLLKNSAETLGPFCLEKAAY